MILPFIPRWYFLSWICLRPASTSESRSVSFTAAFNSKIIGTVPSLTGSSMRSTLPFPDSLSEQTL